MEKELVSVIVPVYNVERYVNECVESICNQSYSNIEIILVDDGSTDHSGEICDEWAEKDQRITVIHKPNGGLSDARNVAIDQAGGAWLMFVDGDDTISSDAVESLYDAVVNYECDMAVCNMVRVYDDGSTEPFYKPTDKPTLLTDTDRFITLKQPSVCNKLFKTVLFDGIRFPKGKYYEDTFVYHVLAYKASKIVLTGIDGYYYRSRRDSILGGAKYSDRYFDFVEATYVRMMFMCEHNVPRYGKEACLNVYAAVSNAEKYLKKTSENAEKRKQMRIWYNEAYKHLMKDFNVGVKQRARCVLLRYCPTLHGKIY